jgi:hypothetical protein
MDGGGDAAQDGDVEPDGDVPAGADGDADLASDADVDADIDTDLVTDAGGDGDVELPPGVEIRVMVSRAPNMYGNASSFDAWVDNAIEGVRAGGPAGDPATPEYFEPIETCGVEVLMVSAFPSWLGVADPGAAYGPAFSDQHGNRPHMVALIRRTDGSPIDIADVLTVHYDPVPPIWDGDLPDLYSEYSDRIVGLDFGPDGSPGGGDDERIETGTGPVDEIVAVAPGIAWATADVPVDLEAQQAALDDLAAWLLSYTPFFVPTSAEFDGELERAWLRVVGD